MAGRRKPQTARPRRRTRAEGGGGSALDPGILGELAGYNIRRAEVHMRQQFERAMGAKGLRPPEFSTLVLIAANPLATQADIAQALNIQRPNMVGLIGGLEARGLVTRTVYEHDRRNQILALTPRGAAALEEAKRIVRELDRRATACWTEREREQVVALLGRLWGRPGPGLDGKGY
jgi:DNA-binding MarR family transcriptional regulator